MLKCPKCNHKVKKHTSICPNCNENLTMTEPQKEKSVLANIISFFHPMAGLFFFLHWDKDNPEKAKSAGKSAIIGKLLSILLTIFIPIIVIAVCWLILNAISH